MTFEIGFYDHLFFPLPTILIQGWGKPKQVTFVWFHMYVGFAE